MAIDVPRPALKGAKALVVGIANNQSIAYGCARAFHELGADLAVTYINEKTKTYVEPLLTDIGAQIFMPLDVAVPGQLRTGNLLTGQLYVALDFFPNAPKAAINWKAEPPEFPVVAGNLEDLKTSIAGITRKLEKVDYEGIGNELRQTLQSTNQLMLRIDKELAPDARALLTDTRQAIVSIERSLGSESPTMQETRAALAEMARAAAAFRALADYLERHPEALLSGKKEEKK